MTYLESAVDFYSEVAQTPDVGLCCVQSTLASDQVACGNSAEANIVVMLDLTGSIERADLEKEKAAAKELLDYFQSANPRPRVAIGTFNAICTL